MPRSRMLTPSFSLRRGPRESESSLGSRSYGNLARTCCLSLFYYHFCYNRFQQCWQDFDGSFELARHIFTFTSDTSDSQERVNIGKVFFLLPYLRHLLISPKVKNLDQSPAFETCISYIDRIMFILSAIILKIPY